jgi:hypothetical protein
MARHHLILLLGLLIVVSTVVPCGAQEPVSISLEGYVYDSDGAPLQDASVRLWGFYLEGETITDSEGYYELQASTSETTCQLYVFHDDPETEGYDLLPGLESLVTLEDLDARFDFSLEPGATVRVTGQLKPMESTSKVNRYALEAVDPSTGTVIQSGDYRLVYGTGMNVQSYFLDLPSTTLIVPLGTPFEVEVSSSYQHERYPPSRYRRYRWRIRGSSTVEAFNEFTMTEGEGFTLEAGEILELDVRRYSLASDLVRIAPLMEEAEAELADVEAQGFYITAERFDVLAAKESLVGLDALIEGSEYETAYVGIRQAYLKILSVRSRLDTVVFEAKASQRVLVAFAALTAVVLGALLTDGGAPYLLSSVALFTVMLGFIRMVFPGTSMIEPVEYATTGAVSLAGALALVYLAPRVLGETVSEGGFAALGSIVVVFSMGSRSLRRRKLRSIFTFAAILCLTMSFVALTSLSSSYGLIFSRYGGEEPGAEGIMVRMPPFTPSNEFEKGLFSPVIAQSIDWAWGNEGVINVAKLAENTPTLRPYGRIGESPIFGIIGVQPEVEPLMPLIDEAVMEGEPLREDGTCLLHRYVQLNADLEVGDMVTVRGVTLRVAGFFGDLGRIADMDGETILPDYQVMTNPDPPTIEVRICEEDTVMVTTLETALLIERVEVSRIDVELEDSTDLETIGKSMALQREYRVWISEGGKSEIAYMGSQVGGKGFPIVIPWAIVVLNVVAMMLNSMFERQREIDILSSIGLNPVHIAGIFVAEASILGITGGSIGYILGLGLYPVMKGLEWAPVISQKVSAVWLLASLGIAVVSVVFGSIIALGRSVSLTPSLNRRWDIGELEWGGRDHWDMRLPVRLTEDERNNFLLFLYGRLENLKGFASVPRISSLKMGEEGKKRTLSFVYDGRDSSVGTTWTTNVISVTRDEEGTYGAVLESRGAKDACATTGTFIRKMTIAWSVQERKQPGD